ncbi:unnamed protein product, partial [Nesidiocoris tenuis]
MNLQGSHKCLTKLELLTVLQMVTYLPARTNDRFNWRAESMKTDSAPRPRMTASSPSGVNEGTAAALEPARAGTASTVPWSNSLEAPAELSSNEVTAAYGETIEEEGPAVGRRGFSPTLGSFRSFTKSMTKIRMRILISMPISKAYKTLKVPQVLTISSCLATQKPPTRASQNPQNVPSVPKRSRRRQKTTDSTGTFSISRQSDVRVSPGNHYEVLNHVVAGRVFQFVTLVRTTTGKFWDVIDYWVCPRSRVSI